VVGWPVAIQPGEEERLRLDRLLLEFKDQWPDRRGWLQERIQGVQQGDANRGWLVYATNLYPPEEEAFRSGNLDQIPCGVILITPGQAATYELFVWMRGAYRNCGIGRYAVQQVLKHFRPPNGARTAQLRVRLPRADLTGPGGKIQQGMWLTFFHHLGFERVKPVPLGVGPTVLVPENGDAAETEVVLQQELRW
jgi:hypothetical protein